MKELVTIVFPVLAHPLTAAECSRLSQYQEHLGDFPMTFLKGETRNIPDQLKDILPRADAVSFDDRYFTDRRAFSRLLLSPLFYEQFSWSRFLLIGDTMTGINKNELAYWCRQGYDLIQHYPSFEKSPSFADAFLKGLYPGKFIRKYGDAAVEFDQLGVFSLRKVDTFSKKTKSKKRTIHEYLTNHPNFQSDSILWEFFTNRFRPELIIPNAISRNRFVQSTTFAPDLSHSEHPFATTVLYATPNLL